MDTAREIIIEIENQLDFLMNARSVFPHLTNRMVGRTQFETPPFYQIRGFNITFNFAQPLTENDVTRISAIGHWINQNYVIRLCAILEANGIILKKEKGKINNQLEGHKEVDIVRRLRNQFAHSSGRYNPSDPDKRKLYRRLVDHFGIHENAQPIDSATDYPVSIDTILMPLTKGCIDYILALHEQDDA